MVSSAVENKDCRLPRREKQGYAGGRSVPGASSGSTNFLEAVAPVSWLVERAPVVRWARLWGAGGWSGLVVLNWAGGVIPILGVEGLRFEV